MPLQRSTNEEVTAGLRWHAVSAKIGRLGGPTISAVFTDGPLAGRSVDVELVEARPPSTVEPRADDGTTCRYCLAEWAQSGPSAEYSFLYRV